MKASTRYVFVFVAALIGAQFGGLAANLIERDFDSAIAETTSSVPPGLIPANNLSDTASRSQSLGNLTPVTLRGPLITDDGTNTGPMVGLWYLNNAAIVSGGTGYALSSSFNVTVAGGTGAIASVVNVTTNGAGVVTTANSVTTAGEYTVLPSITANAATGGAGTGLTLALSYNPTMSSMWISPQGAFAANSLIPGHAEWQQPVGLPGSAALDIPGAGWHALTLTPIGGTGYTNAGTVTCSAAAWTVPVMATVTSSGGVPSALTVLTTGNATSPPTATLSCPGAGGTGLTATVATSQGPVVAYGGIRLRSAYAGNYGKFYRPSDAAELAIGFLANGLQDTASMSGFCEPCSQELLYDQTGLYPTYPNSGYGDANQFTAANMPLESAQNTIGSARSVVLYADNSVQRYLAIPAVVTFDSGHQTTLDVYQAPNNSGNAYLYVMTTGTGQPQVGAVPSPCCALTSFQGNVLTAVPGAATPQAMISTSNQTTNLYGVQNGNVSLATALSRGTYTQAGGSLGFSSATGSAELVVHIVWNYQVPGSVMQGVLAAIYRTLGISPQADTNIVVNGESRFAGLFSATGTTPVTTAAKLINFPATIYDESYSGNTLANQVTNYTVRVVPGLSGAAKQNFIVLAGSGNSASGGATLSDMQASVATYVADVAASQATFAGAGSTTRLTLFLTAELGIISQTAPQQAVLAAFNAWVENLGPGGFVSTCPATIKCGIIDIAADPTLSNAAAPYNPALFYSDNIHGSDQGYRIMGEIMAGAFNAVH